MGKSSTKKAPGKCECCREGLKAFLSRTDARGPFACRWVGSRRDRQQVCGLLAWLEKLARWEGFEAVVKLLLVALYQRTTYVVGVLG